MCVCRCFFPSLQMMEAQGSPCFSVALSLDISGLLWSPISVLISTVAAIFFNLPEKKNNIKIKEI